VKAGAGRLNWAGIEALRAHRSPVPLGDPTQRSKAMSTTPSPDLSDDDLDEPIPAMQQLLDNPFLLLFLGIALPTVLYIIWGVMEIVGIPIAK
jgi:hypothetical protein